MLENSYKATYIPSPSNVKRFFEHSREVATSWCTEVEWYKKVQEEAMKWPEVNVTMQ